MKVPHDSDLMAFADGELDERTMRELEERLVKDVELQDKVEGVAELGELLRGHLELTSDAVPARRFDAVWREIDKAIDREHEEASAPTEAPAQPVPVGLLRRVGRWFDRYRGHVLTGAVSAGAVAALALLLRGPGVDNTPRTGEIASTQPQPRPQPQQPQPQPQPANGNGAVHVEPTLVLHQPTEIEALETPGGTGTVFNLQDEDGNTTVIWVTPEDTVEGI